MNRSLSHQLGNHASLYIKKNTTPRMQLANKTPSRFGAVIEPGFVSVISNGLPPVSSELELVGCAVTLVSTAALLLVGDVLSGILTVLVK
jgi:hypothetical protein